MSYDVFPSALPAEVAERKRDRAEMPEAPDRSPKPRADCYFSWFPGKGYRICDLTTLASSLEGFADMMKAENDEADWTQSDELVAEETRRNGG